MAKPIKLTEADYVRLDMLLLTSDIPIIRLAERFDVSKELIGARARKLGLRTLRGPLSTCLDTRERVKR